MSAVRVARVRASGMRYVVNRIDLETDMVYCLGDVISYHGVRRRHDGLKKFPRAEVEIVESNGGAALSKELFDQASALVERGLLPGYLPSSEAKAIRRQKAAVRREADAAIAEAMSGDMTRLRKLLRSI